MVRLEQKKGQPNKRTAKVALTYWTNINKSNIYVLNSTNTYDCYIQEKDLMGRKYYDRRGTVQRLPNPESLTLVKE